MSLLDVIRDEFDSGVRLRGKQYCDQKRVKITRSSNEEIVAKVRGGELYDVSIDFWEVGAEGVCTCPYSKDPGHCKHIWATLLQAEKEGCLPEGDPQAIDEFDAIESGIDFIRPTVRAVPAHGSKPPPWKRQFDELRQMMQQSRPLSAPKPWPANKRLVYLIDVSNSHYGERTLNVALGVQTPDKAGRWAPARGARISRNQLPSLPNEEDRLIVQLLVGIGNYNYSYYDNPITGSHVLRGEQYELILRRICNTGRCFIRPAEHLAADKQPISWDDGAPWEFWLEVKHDGGDERFTLEGSLRRGEQRMSCRDPLLILNDGLMVTRQCVARVNHFGAFGLLTYLRQSDKRISLAVQQGDEMLQDLFGMSAMPRLDLPTQLQVEQLSPPMRPRLKISPPAKRSYYDDNKLVGKLSFDYGGRIINEGEELSSLFDAASRTLMKRDVAAEAAAVARLELLGFKNQWGDGKTVNRGLAPNKLNKVVLDLCSVGWFVEAEGKLYRQPGNFKIEVTSGIDWFELEGSVDFGGVSAQLPRLLAALRRGEKTVQLDDGSMGMMPDQWLSKYGLLARIAQDDDDKLRFTRGQIGLLDALVSSMPEASCDAVFDQARQELRRFDGIAPIDPPKEFVGELRPYQKEGLGWLSFLNRFGFGGCLADDMGLGKTIQVLALLEDRRRIGKPSLVVVPKSLIFNWIEEAKRFTPQLRILDHTGVGRIRSVERFKDYDVVLTTYGTMRLDAPFLKDFVFDYAILDEAQAIKNGASESAKAARLIRADHRLALSGTPIQNHLGELWSLFEFLNPGMLGGASVFKATGAGSQTIEKEGRELLSRALRPFILRRTKEQVATDLPEKTEQTIWCDLEPEQRRLYDELRDHYRVSLLNRIATEGINKAKIQILEALLRLRQAACNPGLIDKTRVDHASAKLDTLLPQIAEIIDEGHKVLVFSQFTSMLAIVKRHLDKQKIVYEYLDGKTRDRQQRVERFQTDPECKLFLVSLKAGGLGLNLTAAEYVYLLDPWWNPAVESQAIDRAHRIGQTRHVFAYRIIAKDTVEQKVLDLQAKKRDLADMILNADSSLVSKLGREDLELLFS